METLSRRQQKDIWLLGKFVELYCQGQYEGVVRADFAHAALRKNRLLCCECAALLAYAIERRIKCPLEPDKPSCKHCRIHCYGKAEREKIRKVMAYSGRKLLLMGRLDYLWHYFF